MPQKACSEKRERQHETDKAGLRQRGEPDGWAEEIAARTVNKPSARAGESGTARRASTQGPLLLLNRVDEYKITRRR